jgi:hypothetical protein
MNIFKTEYQQSLTGLEPASFLLFQIKLQTQHSLFQYGNIDQFVVDFNLLKIAVIQS